MTIWGHPETTGPVTVLFPGSQRLNQAPPLGGVPGEASRACCGWSTEWVSLVGQRAWWLEASSAGHGLALKDAGQRSRALALWLASHAPQRLALLSTVHGWRAAGGWGGAYLQGGAFLREWLGSSHGRTPGEAALLIEARVQVLFLSHKQKARKRELLL